MIKVALGTVLVFINDDPERLSYADFIENFVLTDLTMTTMVQDTNKMDQIIERAKKEIQDLNDRISELLPDANTAFVSKWIAIASCVFSGCMVIVVIGTLVMTMHHQKEAFARLATTEPGSTELATMPIVM